MADYVQRAMKANFAAAWEEMGATNELEETYALSSVKSLEEGVKNIIQVSWRVLLLNFIPGFCSWLDNLKIGNASRFQ